MILFLYGEDSYRIHEKVKALKEKFISTSLGDTNMAIMDGATATYDEVVRQILALPFLSRKRLVILENVIKSKNKALQEKLPDFLKKIPDSTVLVVTEEGNSDKRTALYKRLSKEKMAQEFALLDAAHLQRWIRREVESRGGEIESDGVNLLSEYIGSDLWRMSNEIQKLIAYNKNITSETIELLVAAGSTKDIFALVDAMGARDLRRAAQEADNLVRGGENEIYIFTMIVYQYRNLIILSDLKERIGSNSYEMAKRAKMHPFVVQKTLHQLQNFTLENLKQKYRTLLNFDLALKTGKMEGKVALSLILAKFCV